MKSPVTSSTTPIPTPPETTEVPVLGLLHSFDPATALHELELLNDPNPTPPATPPTTNNPHKKEPLEFSGGSF